MMRDLNPPYRQLALFVLLALLGTAASFLNVKIPHTEVFIEGRWIFGFIGFVLLKRWWAAMLLAAVLSLPLLSDVPFHVGFFGNTLYAVPSLIVIRLVHFRILDRFRRPWPYALGWFVTVMACYQAFVTPAVWGVVAALQEKPVWAAILEGWRTQPYLVESLLVALVSASAMAARRSNQQFRRLQDVVRTIPQPMSLLSTDYRYLAVNDVYSEIYARPREEIQGRSVAEFFSPDVFDAEIKPQLDRCLAGEIVHYELHADLPGRKKRWMEVEHIPFRNEKGDVAAIVSHSLDITERKLAEEALRESKRLLDATGRMARVGGWELDAETLEVRWTEETYRIHDVPPDYMPPLQEAINFFHPDERERLSHAIQQALDHGVPYDMELRFITARGKHLWTRTMCRPQIENGKTVRLMGTFQDITERKRAEEERARLEEQYRQAQKMEAIGQLTGGVAHDFNNLLQVINGATELALGDIEANHPARETLEEVAKAGHRAAWLVSQLLLFSRRQIMRPKTLDLNEAVQDMLKMLMRVIGEHIRVEWVPGPQVGTIHADRGMVEQALMNLCVNARDAMPDGGILTIETHEMTIDEEVAAAHSWARPGRYALLSVSDTGTGMDKETLHHVFEPFFTTKGTGRGTGLGLATVYGILKQHDGLINVYSEPDQGSVFNLYWPITQPDAQAVEATPESGARSGTETILLAEDDEVVRNLARTVLERAGYTVLTATNGTEAVEIFEARGDEIDLVFLDVVMPETGGREAYERMRADRPELRAVFASGYSEDAIHTDFVLDQGLTFLQKPFGREELLSVIRQVLDSD